MAEQERIIMNHENDIIRLNTSQFEEGRGSDNKELINSEKGYSGRYTYYTQIISLFEHPVAPKKEGKLYNFAWTGDFLRGLQLKILPSKYQFDILSTGTGSGGKKSFFDGYTNLFGLNKNNTEIVNWELIYPDLMAYINKYL